LRARRRSRGLAVESVQVMADETLPPVNLAGRLNREFYQQDPVTVARSLLGQRLVHRIPGREVAGIIVETEAYLGFEDKAAHSYNWRKTARTQTMYADGGTVYVFMIYGIYYLLNIVVAQAEIPQAVLIRAVEPTEGIATMYARRPKARRETDLCSGPGKLGAAFGINLSHNGLDMTTHESLYVEQLRRRVLPASQIVASKRIGVDYAEEWADALLRFHIRGNRHVSIA
jgi:DNA-3-methyladenine glycosylase